MADVVVTFDARGGEVSPSTKTVTVGGTYGQLPTPTKEANTFVGWFDALSKGNQIDSNTVVKTNVDHTLYAVWNAENVTISFSVPSGSVVTPTTKVVQKTFPYGWLPTPTRKGYDFVKWSSNAAGTDEIKSNSIVPSVNPPTVLYSIWKAKQIKVHFNTNGGFRLQIDGYEGGRDYGTVRTYQYGSAFGLLSPDEYRIGAIRLRHWLPRYIYDDVPGAYLIYYSMRWMEQGMACFLGWFDRPDGGTKYTETDICLFEEETTLYAHWDFSKMATTFIFNMCGGIFNGSSSPLNLKYLLGNGGKDIYRFSRLPIPYRANTGFVGWFDVPDGIVKGGDSWRMTGRYYNGWITEETFDSVNAGTEQMQITNSSYFNPEHIEPVPGYPHYLIARLSASAYSEDTNLYAHWQKFSVILDFQGGYSQDSEVRAVYGERLPYGHYDSEESDFTYDYPTIPTYSGHVFAGYFEFPNGEGKRYYRPGTEDGCIADQPWDKFRDGTIYAAWDSTSPTPPEPPEYVTITFMGLSVVTPTFSTKTIRRGEPYGELPEDASGIYTDIYWAISNVRIRPSDICNLTSDATAKFSQASYKTYYISYVANGGTISGTPVTSYNYGTNTFQLPSVSRSGYTFDGWYDNADFIGNPVTSIVKGTTVGNKTFFAKWSGAQYTVSFNPNEGQVQPASKIVEYMGYYGQLPTPIRIGFKFIGWFTMPDGGNIVIAEDIFSQSSNQTLYAHWDAIPDIPRTAKLYYARFREKFNVTFASRTRKGETT